MARLQHTIHALTLQIQRHEAEVVLVHASTATPELVFADQGLAVLGCPLFLSFSCTFAFSLSRYLSLSLSPSRACALTRLLSLSHTHTHAHTRTV